MYIPNPGSSLILGCVLKWPILAPLTILGITAYTFCVPENKKEPEIKILTPVIVAPVDDKKPIAPAPSTVLPVLPSRPIDPLVLPPGKKPKG